ncbi:MAG: thioredoxin family protein [Pseudomonadota bacterium]
MTSTLSYSSDTPPSREAVDVLPGLVLLDFGTDWCGFCLASAPIVKKALIAHPAVRHLKVEDGSGRALGRSFKVKLWPTLIFLADGKEVARWVRPTDGNALMQAFAAIDPGNAS